VTGGSSLLAISLRRRCLERAAYRQIAVLILAGSGLACEGPKPFLVQGNASSVQVGYAGNIESATLVAKQHCAQYERVPKFLEAQEDIAFFDCVLP
jgi:hypothetical protein